MAQQTVEEIFDSVAIPARSAKDLLHAGELDRIAVSKMNTYIGQSLETILRTKLHDLSRNQQAFLGYPNVNQSAPLCFWAFGGYKKTEFIRKHFLSGSESPQSRYVLLPFTDSLLKAGTVDPKLEVSREDNLDVRRSQMYAEEMRLLSEKYEARRLSKKIWTRTIRQ